MWKNFLLIALRNFKQQKLYAFINIIGLSVGLMTFMLISLFIMDELTYDAFYPDSDRIYRLSHYGQQDNGEWEDMAPSGGAWVKQIQEDYPEVSDYVRLTHTGYPGFVSDYSAERVFMEPKFYWADTNYFHFFGIQLKQGDPQTVLQDLDAVVLSESMAQKYFGTENPIGQGLRFSSGDTSLNLVVAGIMYDSPSNTHLKSDFIANYYKMTHLSPEGRRSWVDSYYPSFIFSYLKFEKGSGPEQVKKGFPKILASHVEEERAQRIRPLFVPIEDLHFTPEMKWEFEPPGDKAYVKIFIIAAILVLLIACINFMNLATARSAKRAREVGLRKSLGSSRFQLVQQFYLESFVMTLLAVIVAIGLLVIALPWFNQLSGKEFSLVLMLKPVVLLGIVILILIVGLLSGSYPALYLSRFNPASVMRGTVGGKGEAEFVRKSLVVFQFGVTISLVISTMVIFQQLKLIHKGKLASQKDQLLSIRLGGYGLNSQKYLTYMDEISREPGIMSTSVAVHLPRLRHFGRINNVFTFPGRDDEEREWNKFDVDYDFPEVFDLEFLAGRSFERGRSTDSVAIILNESAIKELGISPEEAVGMTIVQEDVFEITGQRQDPMRSQVIGVVKDFPYESVHNRVKPLAIRGQNNLWDRILYVKLSPQDIGSKIDHLEATWREQMVGLPFQHWFLDEEFGRMYTLERRMAKVFMAFTSLTILIAMLGLFALTAYTTERRTKEIGIRKVLGASSGQIVWLLSSYFARLVALGFLIAIPVSWWAMNAWLEDFAYRVKLDVLTILLAGIMALVFALLTVSYQSYKASRANPSLSLRDQ